MGKLTFIVAGIALFSGGCSLIDEGHGKPPYPTDVRSAERVFTYFQASFFAGNYHKAYSALSPATRSYLSFEEFYLSASNFSAFRQFVGGLVVQTTSVNGDEGTIRLINREFGVSCLLRLKCLTFQSDAAKSMWSLEIPKPTYVRFVEAGKMWYNLQMRDLGAREYAVPPWWRYRPLNVTIDENGVSPLTE